MQAGQLRHKQRRRTMKKPLAHFDHFLRDVELPESILGLAPLGQLWGGGGGQPCAT